MTPSVHRCLRSNNTITEQWHWLEVFFGVHRSRPISKQPIKGGGPVSQGVSHGSETSPNRTHSNAQGGHEVRALQPPPNAAHADRAISKQARPSLYEVPANSTRAAAPRVLGGARHGGGNRAVTSQPRAGQSTSYGDVKPACGGGRGVGQEGVRKRGTQERQQTRGGAIQTQRTREPHQEG